MSELENGSFGMRGRQGETVRRRERILLPSAEEPLATIKLQQLVITVIGTVRT